MSLRHKVSCFLRPMIIAFMILLSIGLGSSSALPRSAPSNESAIEARIRHIQDGLMPPVIVEGEALQTTKLTDRMSQLGVPGVSIAVIHGGKIEWARGFGVMKTGGPPVTPDTLFQAASISKPVTALTVLRLVEGGKLDLNVDVNQYLKSWKVPANNFTEQSKVTLRGLLSHSAGMTVHGFPGYASNEPMPSLVQVLNGEKPANTQPIVVETVPGTIFNYSGGGYVVIQQLLEDVTGQPFTKLVQDMVLKPIGMIHSTYEQPLPAGRIAEAATPYTLGSQPVNGGPHVYPEIAPAGLWTTPSDLARYAIAVQESLSGKLKSLLSEKMAREMLTPVLLKHGLGPQVGGSEQHPYFTHGGSNAGFQCNLVAYNQGDGAVIMTNSDTGSLLLPEILRTIAYEYGWPDFQPMQRKEITVESRVLEQFVGTYELSPKVNLMITLEDNQLMVQASGQMKIPLLPFSETMFFSKVIEVVIEFVKNSEGKVTHLTFNENGNQSTAQQISDTVSERKEITLSPNILERYTGIYEILPGINVTITFEGNQLFRQVTGQSKTPLFAESETKFFLKAVDAQYEFIQDDKGVVAKIIIHQGINQFEAQRK